MHHIIQNHEGGSFIATSWLKPIRTSKGKHTAQTIRDSLDYIMNPEKTRNGELVSAYGCDPRTAASEFYMSKREYSDLTGRERKKDVLMYHVRISFKPGEITPELANKIGYDLTMRYTKGKQAFVCSTHEDKEHIHCHIMFNAVNLDCDRKFHNFWGSSFALRRLTDIICVENGLSIIKDPKPSKGNYGDWLAHKKDPTAREKLERLIDDILATKPANFEEFIRLLKEAECKIKHGKHLSILMKGQKRSIRLRSLSDDYSEAAIRERIDGKRIVQPKKSSAVSPAPADQNATQAKPQKFSLLIDVQNSIKAQGSPGYEAWAKKFSLKQAAKTLIFLQENNLDDWDKLSEAAQKAKDNFNAIQTTIHAADSRLKDISTMQKHIGTYIKTKDTYAQYKAKKFSKKFYSENEKALTDHKAAKTYFDEQKLEKLPTIKMLQQEYATLLAEKKKMYSSHAPARDFMQEILMAKQNVEILLNHKDPEMSRDARRDER